VSHWPMTKGSAGSGFNAARSIASNSDRRLPSRGGLNGRLLNSRLQPMIDAAKTIKRHWNGIVRWHDTHIANGILEGINSLVQAAKAKARGYRTLRNLKAMIYLIAGKLDILAST